MAESEEELKGFLMKVKEESEKVGLKFNIQENLWSPSAVLLMIGCPLEPPGSFKKKKKTFNIQKMKIMASGPITSRQREAETMETVTDYFLGLQNHCRW